MIAAAARIAASLCLIPVSATFPRPLHRLTQW
jgi:hypothetical protein